MTERTALIGNVAGHRASPNTDLDILLNLLGRALSPTSREAYPISTRFQTTCVTTIPELLDPLPARPGVHPPAVKTGLRVRTKSGATGRRRPTGAFSRLVLSVGPEPIPVAISTSLTALGCCGVWPPRRAGRGFGPRCHDATVGPRVARKKDRGWRPDWRARPLPSTPALY